MAVTDGQRVNAAVTNAAFVSRTVDSDTVGIVGLNHPTSGGLISNAQQQINDNEANITSNDVDIADLQANKENKSEKGVANGYAELDGTGRIPVAQLPLDTMVYQGTWDASTNTPTLADGVGTTGDYYRTSVAGTQDLGSGSLTFSVGDSVIYNGSIWEKQDFAGASSLDDLSDVDTTTNAPVLNDVLTYTGSEWEPQAPAVGTLTTTAVAANYTVLSSDDVVLVTTGGTDRTITLPDATGLAGKKYQIKKVDSGTGQCIVETFSAGSQAIDQDTWSGNFYLLAQDESISIVSDGTQWWSDSIVLNEVLQATSATKFWPSATNLLYLQMTGNSLDLGPAIYELNCYVEFQTAASGPQYNFTELNYATANGNDTTTAPALLTVSSGNNAGFNISGSTTDNISRNNYGHIAPASTHTALSNTTVYAVPRAAGNNITTSSAATTFFTARRIG